ncbi:SDR family NAD(P)-dependent oxidoreductase [Gordonia alkanivorans]|uniref:Acetoin dehydrogenase n=1 Tax=Gordonia alkanivorans CGMCC 6845 TaxID=1423140 RepID=W9DGR4_9ACTN|nr:MULTISPECIES: SDR family oxidoreductase [Gordonia]ETA05611.1 acetoin dehydrogenase [Gordonia alkanivorans CGMCC 6845]MBN0974951.1 SDR family oxidoreductase [Gordonia sp. BP-119]MBN0984985.1 SDR family oxidoreductase [Gordonia sp. BP-94]MDH3043697.1 SDR family NAD(P)-dependent oxidoreductase [Gordonia alkanivorans]MDH3052516.1 SDR family NAD(P)-dependent oxidoreductase [Gordonia alkanivorans]
MSSSTTDNYANQVAVVTGAASGIGRSLALQLAGRGASLSLSDVDEVHLAETAAMCRTAHRAKVETAVLDVADRAAFQDYAESVQSSFGCVNMVFNNAGVALGADVVDMSWEDFDWLMGINFGGVVNGTKAFLPYLIASGDGHLVNTSSVFGLVGIPSQSAYNAAKFGVRGFTEALRQEMKISRHPVTVTCVHPGGVKTNIVNNARGVSDMGADTATIATMFNSIARTTPEKAASTILKGMDKKKPRVLIGADARGFDFVARVVGPRYQDISAPITRAGYAFARKRGIIK